ncbi:chromosome partitioning protein [Kineococcus indalonis]|uniref:chromosome partitioning protein n=1 Tax=Kineococcus indalonis TaxID=2696566 RepID=UPI0014129FAF|nr:chromosome partitioning protein [Kineococcus indalonis]NAZ84567.1 chromosome partitioning protein [Kineococcus indalonis]
MSTDMSIDTTEVPTFPLVDVWVDADGSADIAINGRCFTVRAGTVDDAVAQSVQLIAERAAQPVGRAVLVTTTDPDGDWRLVISPDGTVREAPTTARATERQPRPTRIAPAQPEVTVHEPPHEDPALPAEEPLWEQEDTRGAHRDAERAAPVQPASLPARAEVPAVIDLTTAPAPVQTPDAAVQRTPVAAPTPTPAQDHASAADASRADDSPFSRLPKAKPVHGPESTRSRWSARRGGPQTAAQPVPVPAALPPRPTTGAATAHSAAHTPTLDDLMRSNAVQTPTAPAQQGWQGAVRQLSSGRLALQPGRHELQLRALIEKVRRPLEGPRTIVVANPKGGGTKTTTIYCLAATLGLHRGGGVLAWDNNETRGTLGWRGERSAHTRTAIDLLRDLEQLRAGGLRVGDLDRYVRQQFSSHFGILASDENPASSALIDGEVFMALHRPLAQTYRILLIDTGNNMRASNWQAALNVADQLVIASTAREDTAQSAAWLIDGLRAAGKEEVVAGAVTVLTGNPQKGRAQRKEDEGLNQRLYRHFRSATREVVTVPHDGALIGGGPINMELLQDSTREAWLRAAAAVVGGL